jgi:hypothetical protein
MKHGTAPEAVLFRCNALGDQADSVEPFSAFSWSVCANLRGLVVSEIL